MVAVIKTGSSLRRIINYNEQKVKASVAACILAANYPKDVELLTLNNKLNRLLNQAALNENVTRNSVHISLNFDSSEKLSPNQLTVTAETYMQKIGFGQQPYLVYRHHNAGYPHIHLVSVKVRADGSRMDLQNIGRNQSETARKEIEQLFGLVKAEDRNKRQKNELNPAYVSKVQYRRSETRRAITNVLDAVLNNYKYTSLPELNAILGQYNIIADAGSEKSRVHQHQGLLYRIVDEQGDRVGVPIKASNFYNKLTRMYLEERFQQNETSRQPHKARVRNAIEVAFLKQPNSSLTSIAKALEKEGIVLVQRKNSEGFLYGITYVDHRTKCVFNGSTLGKPYSAQGMQQRCAPEESLVLPPVRLHIEKVAGAEQQVLKSNSQRVKQNSSLQPSAVPSRSTLPSAIKSEPDQVLNILLQPEPSFEQVPHQLKNNSKKKKRKRRNGQL